MVRKYNILFYERKECYIMKLETTKDMCAITKRVIHDFNELSDMEFLCKYACRKNVYLKRVKKYGDPYMNAPLAKIGKWISKHFS